MTVRQERKGKKRMERGEERKAGESVQKWKPDIRGVEEEEREGRGQGEEEDVYGEKRGRQRKRKRLVTWDTK